MPVLARAVVTDDRLAVAGVHTGRDTAIVESERQGDLLSQRFVMVKDEAGSGRVNLVLNWTEELKRLVPAR